SARRFSKPPVGASLARACKTTSAPALSRPFADMAESPHECYKVESFGWTIQSVSSRFPPAAMLRSMWGKNPCSFYQFSNVYPMTRPDMTSRLNPDDQKHVEEYLHLSQHRVERRPFRPW